MRKQKIVRKVSSEEILINLLRINIRNHRNWGIIPIFAKIKQNVCEMWKSTTQPDQFTYDLIVHKQVFKLGIPYPSGKLKVYIFWILSKVLIFLDSVQNINIL